MMYGRSLEAIEEFSISCGKVKESIGNLLYGMTLDKSNKKNLETRKTTPEQAHNIAERIYSSIDIDLVGKTNITIENFFKRFLISKEGINGVILDDIDLDQNDDNNNENNNDNNDNRNIKKIFKLIKDIIPCERQDQCNILIDLIKNSHAEFLDIKSDEVVTWFMDSFKDANLSNIRTFKMTIHLLFREDLQKHLKMNESLMKINELCNYYQILLKKLNTITIINTKNIQQAIHEAVQEQEELLQNAIEYEKVTSLEIAEIISSGMNSKKKIFNYFF